jgi:adenosine deaminase
LEVRLAPEDSDSELRKLIEVVEEVAGFWMPVAARAGAAHLTRGQKRPKLNPTLELGIVFHFIKQRGGGRDKGVPAAGWSDSNANPDHPANRPNARNPTGYRYAQYHREKLHQARTLAWLFRNYPLSLEIVRGLDICTDEIGVPNWVFVPVLQYVREAAATASAAAWRTHGLSLPTLRTTIHAGEDFVHLLSGLRQVDEAVEGFELRTGDRIGHGIALGVDARDWARWAGRLPMIREERLWDLVWERSWYGRGGHCCEQGRQSFLDREIAALSEQVFRRPVPPYELEMLGRDLRRPEALARVGFPDGLPPDSVLLGERQRLLDEYLSDALLFQRGREFVWVDTASEGEVLASLQAELRQKVGTLGLTVEVNPTSNLLIGNLGDLTVHPLWRLRPPREGDGAPPVSVCIGSDDPVVFASNLRQEYQILCDAMILAGLSDEEARQWLDRTRASGMETRFTLSERSGQIASGGRRF